ncbi:MAG: hypothetical protein A4E28_01495 [Methanocella sp. PtaU1.Bin125]|nr:MAG: hypothetical protein A4E28_01495 [Methanocella sp. PtaU1.Bin125]
MKSISKILLAIIAIAALTVTISGCTTPTPVPSASPTPAPSISPTAAPAPGKTWDNGNVGAITATAQNPTEVTFSKPVNISYINTYHWNGAKGATPGTISLKSEDGTIYGPWQATGADGQGGVKNAYWVVYPYVTLKAGKYTVIDSDPSTWATNSAGNYIGFAHIKYNETA